MFAINNGMPVVRRNKKVLLSLVPNDTMVSNIYYALYLLLAVKSFLSDVWINATVWLYEYVEYH